MDFKPKQPDLRMPIDDKDHVFARFKGDKPSADRRETLTIARRGSAPGSRSVEVVRVRSGLADKDRQRRTDPHVRAVSWEGGFTARQPSPPSLPAKPAPAAATEQVAHYMPPLAPTLLAAETDRAVEAALLQPTIEGGAKVTRTREAEQSDRRVADPFDVTDDGANCMRCGYAIEPARERRGLMTCAGCE